MRPDKFTSKLQEALADAQSLAVGLDHNYIEPIHILSAFFECTFFNNCFALLRAFVLVYHKRVA